MLRRFVLLASAIAILIATVPGSASAAAGKLRAGAGQADVTPLQTGYYLGGFTRADRLALGQHTRLFAKTIVLERGGERVALVALDLFMIPAGMQQQIAALAGDGFETSNVLILPTHTHSGPGGFANFPTYNTAAPSPETITSPTSFVELLDPKPADRQLYTFLATQIAKSIRRAKRDLGPAMAGWGDGEIVGLTRNRSIEAHLANHEIIKARGAGSPAEDPEGSVHTIDPAVDVLRVDKIVRGRRVPIGGFSSFADHGTVVKAPFQAYNGDHHATAHRVFEKKVRRAGKVPKRQLVLNVYGNGNEGDMSAGLDNTGPAGANYVGRVEAKEMFAAWKRAGSELTRKPELDLRWTRVCFCGRQAGGGQVASEGRAGAPFFTGSEEERGPLFDVTCDVLEDRRSPTVSEN
ncbi:MAG: neutral/alkaline non-lysosomal ceramidase N-terminal domain-containing protein [Solirubrobacterales bacterium]